MAVRQSKNPISHGRIHIEITCDASKKGWGAVCNRITTEQSQHINELELLAIKFALKVFKPKLSGKHGKILSDNTTDVCYINSNRESRIFNERTEWQLNPDVFSQIRDLWVTPEIDLFATQVNTQLAMFASWKPDPEAPHIDAFTIDWSQYKFSFLFFSRCFRKVQMDKAEGILIAPIWPTQVWWPQMLRLLIRHPLALPQQKTIAVTQHILNTPTLSKTGADGLLHIRRYFRISL